MKNKTGKGWKELSKDYKSRSLTEKEFQTKLEELFKNEPVSDKEYIFNLLENMSPAGRELFDKLLKEEVERFLEEQKKHKHKYFKNRFR